MAYNVCYPIFRTTVLDMVVGVLRVRHLGLNAEKKAQRCRHFSNVQKESDS